MKSTIYSCSYRGLTDMPVACITYKTC
jgi:hypothetical protein